MERVVITGMGILSPIGNNKEDFWEALAAGKSGIVRITRFDPKDLRSQIGGEISGFQPEKFMEPKDIKQLSSFIQYAIVCAKMAQADAGIEISAVNL